MNNKTRKQKVLPLRASDLTFLLPRICWVMLCGIFMYIEIFVILFHNEFWSVLIVLSVQTSSFPSSSTRWQCLSHCKCSIDAQVFYISVTTEEGTLHIQCIEDEISFSFTYFYCPGTIPDDILTQNLLNIDYIYKYNCLITLSAPKYGFKYKLWF